MGTTWNLIRVAKSRLRHMAIFVLAAVIGWTSATQLLVCTPDGVHCPTAPTQAVMAKVVCCGKVVGYTARKPQPGEKGFVQCRCAEKQSAQHQATFGQGPPHFDLLASKPVLPVVPDRIPEVFVASTAMARTVAVANIPFVPPPSLA